MLEWLHNQAVNKKTAYLITEDGYLIISDKDTLELGEMMFERIREQHLTERGNG